MKKFYKDVKVEPYLNKFQIHLDNKAIKTPLKETLEIETFALAQEVAKEWRDQGDTIKPEHMPITQLATSFQDKVKGQKNVMIEQIMAFIDSDPLLFFDHDNPELLDAQNAYWKTAIHFIERRANAVYKINPSLAIEQQSPAIHGFFKDWLNGLTDAQMNHVQYLIFLGQSPILSYNFVYKNIDSATFLRLMNLEEHIQNQQWGQDYTVEDRQEREKKDLENIIKFSDLMNVTF